MKNLCILFLIAPLLLVADDGVSINQALNQIEADEQAAINQAAANQAAADQAAENQAAQNQSENDQSTVYDPDNPAQLEVNSDVVAPGAYVDPYRVDPYRHYNNENRYEDHHMENQYQDRHLENADNPYRDNHQYENRNMNQEHREDRSMERPHEGVRGRR